MRLKLETALKTDSTLGPLCAPPRRGTVRPDLNVGVRLGGPLLEVRQAGPLLLGPRLSGPFLFIILSIGWSMIDRARQFGTGSCEFSETR